MKITKTLFAAIGFVVLFAGQTFAHKVIIFAWVEDGMIYSESSFGSKKKARDCPIIVIDEKGRIVHNGQTDSQGRYSFKIPENIGSDLILTLDAGIGHQARWRIPEKELVTVSSAKNVLAAMKEKEKLEKNPSLLNIITGIAIIFLLAFAVKFLKHKAFPK